MRGWAMFVGGVVLASASSAPLAGGQMTPRTEPPSEARALSRAFANVARAMAPSVVRIEVTTATEQATASGIIIDTRGNVITSSHAMDGATPLSNRGRAGGRTTIRRRGGRAGCGDRCRGHPAESTAERSVRGAVRRLRPSRCRRVGARGRQPARARADRHRGDHQRAGARRGQRDDARAGLPPDGCQGEPRELGGAAGESGR